MASTVSNGNDRSEKWQRPFTIGNLAEASALTTAPNLLFKSGGLCKDLVLKTVTLAKSLVVLFIWHGYLPKETEFSNRQQYISWDETWRRFSRRFSCTSDFFILF